MAAETSQLVIRVGDQAAATPAHSATHRRTLAEEEEVSTEARAVVEAVEAFTVAEVVVGVVPLPAAEVAPTSSFAFRYIEFA